MTPQGTGPRGKQDYGTPSEFLKAVRYRFGGIDWDLAATPANAVATDFITPQQDSLKVPWPIYRSPRFSHVPVTCWLNPPFADIEPWARKCQAWVEDQMVTPGSKILFLVPASIGTNWWRHHVADRARVLAVSPRLTFVGCDDPFPKDCALCVFERSWPWQPKIVEPWNWKEELAMWPEAA